MDKMTRSINMLPQVLVGHTDGKVRFLHVHEFTGGSENFLFRLKWVSSIQVDPTESHVEALKFI